MSSAPRVRPESNDGAASLVPAMSRNNNGENSAENSHENNTGDDNRINGDSAHVIVDDDDDDSGLGLNSETGRAANMKLEMENAFDNVRIKQEDGEERLLHGAVDGNSNANNADNNTNNNNSNNNNNHNDTGLHRMSNSGMASLDEMDASDMGEIQGLGEEEPHQANHSASNHGESNADLNNTSNNSNDNDDDMEEEDGGDGEEDGNEGDEGDGEDEEDEEELEDDYEDDLEDDLDEPSGAFANVAQGLVGKYKNYMMQYWQNTIDSIERDEHDFKNHQLPLARIKKVMKTDEEVKMISAEAPILFAKGCDIFITELTMRAWIHAEENKRRTLQKSDIAAALQKSDMFDFLIDIVPREEERPKRKSQSNIINTAVPQQMQVDPNVQMSVPMTDDQMYGQYQQPGYYQQQQQYHDNGSGDIPGDVQDTLDQGTQQDDNRYYQQQQQQQQQYPYQ